LRAFLRNPKNREKDKKQKTKNIKIIAENAKYLKKKDEIITCSLKKLKVESFPRKPEEQRRR